MIKTTAGVKEKKMKRLINRLIAILRLKGFSTALIVEIVDYITK